jgi:hypothetical protein
MAFPTSALVGTDRVGVEMMTKINAHFADESQHVPSEGGGGTGMTPVNSVSALEALTGVADGDRRWLAGYYASGDCEGTPVRRVAGSSATRDGADIFTSADGGRWIRERDESYFSVLWAGAKGDVPSGQPASAGTSDTTKLQAAIDAAGANCTLDFHDRRYSCGRLKQKWNYQWWKGNDATIVTNLGNNTTVLGPAADEYNVNTAYANITEDNTVTSIYSSLSAGANITKGDITLTLGSAVPNAQVGDIVLVETSVTDSPATDYRLGSMKRIKAKNVGNAVLTLDTPLENTLTTGQITGIDIKRPIVGWRIDGINGELIADYHQEWLMVACVADFHLQHCRVSGGGYSFAAIYVTECFDSLIEDCETNDFLDAYGHFGYGIKIDGHNNTVRRCRGARCKHMITTGARDYVCRKLRYENCYGIDPQHGAFDFHANVVEGEMVDCLVEEVGRTFDTASGFQIRGRHQHARQCKVYAASAIAGSNLVGFFMDENSVLNNQLDECEAYGSLAYGIRWGEETSGTSRGVATVRPRIRNFVYDFSGPLTSNGTGIVFREPLEDADIHYRYIQARANGIWVKEGGDNVDISGAKMVFANGAGGTSGVLLDSATAKTFKNIRIRQAHIKTGTSATGPSSVPVKILANYDDIEVSGCEFDMVNNTNPPIDYASATALTRMIRFGNMYDKYTVQTISAATNQILPYGDYVYLTLSGAIILNTAAVMASGFDGQQVILTNVGTADLTIPTQSGTGSLATSKIRGSAGTIVLTPNDSVILRYNNKGWWAQISAVIAVN